MAKLKKTFYSSECFVPAMVVFVLLFNSKQCLKKASKFSSYLDQAKWIMEADAIYSNAQVKPQFYAFRWITLLLSQEFNFQSILRIWDSLLSNPFGVQVPIIQINFLWSKQWCLWIQNWFCLGYAFADLLCNAAMHEKQAIERWFCS